jgi:hypothetical protein
MKIKKFIIDLYQFQNIIGIEIWNWILVYIITKAKRTTTKIVLIPSGQLMPGLG